jgi:hypothetical protein
MSMQSQKCIVVAWHDRTARDLLLARRQKNLTYDSASTSNSGRATRFYMASGRLRLNRSGSQLQLPPAKSLHITDDLDILPPIESTSHWILNDKIVVEQRRQAGCSTGNGYSVCDADGNIAASMDSSSLKASDVIVISSSEDRASDCSFISEGECVAHDAVLPLLDSECKQQTPIAVAVTARLDDDFSDEQIYTFGEEEEFLSQAAVAKWQKVTGSADKDRAEPESILEDISCGTCSPPVQELMAFLSLHNLNSLLPTLLAHEVVSISCMCILTHNDIV